MNRPKIKILLVQITNKNFGDTVIADNTRYLLQKACRSLGSFRYEILDYAIGLLDVGQVACVDAVVFAGGGLIKFRQEKLYEQVSQLILAAQEHGVPVFLSAVGVEGYDGGDERCRMLVEALNQPCVRAITVRDDLACLREHYLANRKLRTREVFDPAVWTKKTYAVERKGQACRMCIGLGVARAALFADYGTASIDRAFLLDMWKGLAGRIEEAGYDWELFTNGLGEDEEFAEEVLAAIGHGRKARGPFDAGELVKLIAGFDGIIACRMHANIIAYALGIPSVGLIWNEKLAFWGKKCGYPQRFLASTELTPERLLACMEQAFSQGTRRPSFFRRYGTYYELKRFVLLHVRRREKTLPEKASRMAKHMVATAMGSSDFRYRNLNTISQMRHSLEHGYRYLELDVRMSGDGALVCVNGWGGGTLAALGKPKESGELTQEEFLQSSYYGHFSTCTFAQMLEAFAKAREAYPGAVLILDVGKPKTELLADFYGQLVETLKGSGLPAEAVRIRMQRERDVNAFKKLDYPCRLIYYLSAEAAAAGKADERYQKALEFCRKKKIKMISVTDQTWTPQLQRELSDEKFQTLVLSYTRAGDVISAVGAGAQLVASHYYSVDYMERLLSDGGQKRSRNAREKKQ